MQELRQQNHTFLVLAPGAADDLGYPYWDETDNAAYRAFLSTEGSRIDDR